MSCLVLLVFACKLFYFVCRSVGVSNFGVQHLEGMRKASRPAPAVNQIELHPLKQQQHIVEYCREHGTAVMGYSPMAKGDRMNDDKLVEMASRFEHYTAQYNTVKTFVVHFL